MVFYAYLKLLWYFTNLHVRFDEAYNAYGLLIFLNIHSNQNYIFNGYIIVRNYKKGKGAYEFT